MPAGEESGIVLEMDVPWILQFSKYWLYSLFFALNLTEDSMGTAEGVNMPGISLLQSNWKWPCR